MTAPPESTRSPVRLFRSRGDAAVGLVVPAGQLDRLAVLFSFTAVGGEPFQVELTRADVGRAAADLVRILAADADEVCRWWYRLSADRHPGRLDEGREGGGASQ